MGGHTTHLREREFAAQVEQDDRHRQLQHRPKQLDVPRGNPVQRARADKQPDEQVRRDLGQVQQIREHACRQANAKQETQRTRDM